MTPAELDAIRKRIEGTAPISNAAHDCRALLAYVDELSDRMRIEETEKWIDLHAKAAKEIDQLREVIAAADAWHAQCLAAAKRLPDDIVEDYPMARAREAYEAARAKLEAP